MEHADLLQSDDSPSYQSQWRPFCTVQGQLLGLCSTEGFLKVFLSGLDTENMTKKDKSESNSVSSIWYVKYKFYFFSSLALRIDFSQIINIININHVFLNPQRKRFKVCLFFFLFFFATFREHTMPIHFYKVFNT